MNTIIKIFEDSEMMVGTYYEIQLFLNDSDIVEDFNFLIKSDKDEIIELNNSEYIVSDLYPMIFRKKNISIEDSIKIGDIDILQKLFNKAKKYNVSFQ